MLSHAEKDDGYTCSGKPLGQQLVSHSHTAP